MSLSLVTYSHGLTVADLIARCEANLYGLQRTEINSLATTATTTATTMTMADAMSGVRAGSFIEVDQEECYVRSADTNTLIATVRRGMNGTTAAQHGFDSIVRVEPRFSQQHIIQALRADIASWPTTVYARYVGHLPVASTTRGVNVDGLAGIDGAQLIAAQRAPLYTFETVWPTIPNARLTRRQDTAQYPSGYALEFPNYGGNLGPRTWGIDDIGYVQNFSAFTALVRCKAPFDLSIFSAGVDVGQVIGMPLTVAEIAPVGAAARLLMTRDIPRTDTSAMGRSRPAEEVHVGDATQTARALLQFRDSLIAEAAKSLYLSEEGFRLEV
jgi:hypothetical protein